MSRPPLGSTFPIFGINISWYSLLMIIAVALGIWLATREERRLKLPEESVLNASLLAIPLGIIGARLYYAAFSWEQFEDDWIELFRVWNGGLAIYGAILGGLLALFIASRKFPSIFPSLLDAAAPSAALGQAIGRWGNYANMEAYGERIYNPAFQFFPLAVEVRIAGVNGTEFWYWHMATFFYEFVWNLIVFFILMSIRTKTKRRGDVVCWYTMLYCAGRTVIEGLRNDSLLLNVGGAQIRVSQVISGIACLTVAVLFFVRLARARKIKAIDSICCLLAVLGIACAFVGEFERNAYQMLFIAAQIQLGAILALDAAFLAAYVKGARSLGTPGAIALVSCFLCAGTLALGIGRLGENNIVYIALRQSVSMLHVVLAGAWFYLRGGRSRRRERVAGEVTEWEGDVEGAAP